MVKLPETTPYQVTHAIRDALSFGLIDVAEKLIVEELAGKHPPEFVALLLQLLVLKKPTGKPKKEEDLPAWRKWDEIGSQYAEMQFDNVHGFRQKLAKKYKCHPKTVNSIFLFYQKACELHYSWR